MEASAAASAVWRMNDAVREDRNVYASIEGYGSSVPVKSATIHSDNLITIIDADDREILIGPERLEWVVTESRGSAPMDVPNYGAITAAGRFGQATAS